MDCNAGFTNYEVDGTTHRPLNRSKVLTISNNRQGINMGVFFVPNNANARQFIHDLFEKMMLWNVWREDSKVNLHWKNSRYRIRPSNSWLIINRKRSSIVGTIRLDFASNGFPEPRAFSLKWWWGRNAIKLAIVESKINLYDDSVYYVVLQLRLIQSSGTTTRLANQVSNGPAKIISVRRSNLLKDVNDLLRCIQESSHRNCEAVLAPWSRTR